MAVTITGTWEDGTGAAVANGTLFLTLSQAAVLIGTTQVAPSVISILLDSNGKISNTAPQIFGNDALSPAGTVYFAKVVNANGQTVWQPNQGVFISGTSFNFNNALPTSAGVILANAVLQNPSGPQSITGFGLTLSASAPLTVNGAANFNGATTFTGTTTIGKQNNVRIVDGILFTTVQAAVTDIGSNPGIVIVPPTCTGSCLTFPSPWPTGIVVEFMDAPAGTASVPTSTTLGFGGMRQIFSSGGTETPTYANNPTLQPFKIWRRMYTNNTLRQWSDNAFTIDAAVIANDASDASHSLGGPSIYNLLSGATISVIRHDPAAIGAIAGISMIVTDDSGSGLSGKQAMFGLENDNNNQSGASYTAWDDTGSTPGTGDWYGNGILDISTGAYSAGIGLHMKTNEPIGVSLVQISGNVLTMTVASPFGFSLGPVYLSNFSGASFLNGQTVTLTNVNLATSVITANFTHANYGPTADSGIAYNENSTWTRGMVIRDWSQVGIDVRNNNPGSTGWAYDCEDTLGTNPCFFIWTKGGNAGTLANIKAHMGLDGAGNFVVNDRVNSVNRFVFLSGATGATQLNTPANTVIQLNPGTGGYVQFQAGNGVSWTEGSVPTNFATLDMCYGDSTLHQLKCSYNNNSNNTTTFYPIPQTGNTAGTHSDSGFYQTASAAGCTTAASIGGTCATAVTITWPVAFADANYKVACQGSGAITNFPIMGSVTARVAANATVQTMALTAAAASFATIECIAVHN